MNMNTADLKFAIRIGEFLIDPNPSTKKGAYANEMLFDWDPAFHMKDRKRYSAMVYFIIVDGRIMKIGQTSPKNGIRGSVNFYIKAGFDTPGANRFAINALIRREIARGSRVEFYIQRMEPVEFEFPGIDRTEKIMACPDGKIMEQVCKRQYLAHMGEHPPWNFQERHEEIPNDIQESHRKYLLEIVK